MPIKKILIETVVITVVATLLGFANNFINPNRVAITAMRPVAPSASDAELEADSLQGPVVVDREQLKKLVSEQGAILIDARLPEEYDAGHIPGAINIPIELFGEFIDTIEALPRDAWLIGYCDGPPCDKGKNMAEELFYMGFMRVAYYDAGMDDWKSSEEVQR